MKNLFTFLLMAILAIGYSHATTEAIDFSKQKYENQQVVTTLKGENCTITFGKGSNPCAYYNTGKAVRIYGGGSVQITSNLAITKVVYTFSVSMDFTSVLVNRLNTFPCASLYAYLLSP